MIKIVLLIYAVVRQIPSSIPGISLSMATIFFKGRTTCDLCCKNSKIVFKLH